MNKKTDQIIFTNGVFDVLHVGHFNLLSFCRVLAGQTGHVVIGLDSDEKVKIDKGLSRPIHTFEERKNQILQLKGETNLVNEVYEFNSNEELHDLIKFVGPDVIVKGSDWRGNVVGSELAEVIIVPNYPFSSTKLIEKIRK